MNLKNGKLKARTQRARAANGRLALKLDGFQKMYFSPILEGLPSRMGFLHFLAHTPEIYELPCLRQFLI